jgi:hypothetical protein
MCNVQDDGRKYCFGWTKPNCFKSKSWDFVSFVSSISFSGNYRIFVVAKLKEKYVTTDYFETKNQKGIKLDKLSKSKSPKCNFGLFDFETNAKN